MVHSPFLRRCRPLTAPLWLCAAVLLAACGGRGIAPGGTVWRLDPRNAGVEAHVRVGGHPCGLAVGSAAVWTTDLDPGALYRVDLAGTGASRRLALPGKNPCGVATGAGPVWVGTAGGEVIRVPPGRGVDTGARAGLGNLTVYGSAVWAVDLAGAVVRLRGSPARVPGIGGTEQLAPLDGAVWAIAAGPGELVRIDVRTLAVRRFPIGPSPKAMATGDGAVWVALTDRRLLRFDPRRGRAAFVARLPDAPILLAPGRGTVWSLAANGRLTRIEEDTGHAAVARAFGHRPFGLELGGGGLWVGTRG